MCGAIASVSSGNERHRQRAGQSGTRGDPEYELIPYLINDGEKHPFAIICPGGGYFMVASHKEGDPIAKELNKRGYHAFVLYYRVRRKARYPHPQEPSTAETLTFKVLPSTLNLVLVLST